MTLGGPEPDETLRGNGPDAAIEPRASLMPPSSSDEPTLRIASDSDMDWLVELRLTTMVGHFERAGHALSADDHRNRVIDHFDAIRIVEMAGEPIGMIKIIRDPDCWHLVQIQITPGHQGRGIGGALVRELLAEADGTGLPVALQVLKVNPAKRLYDRLGFEVVSDAGHSFEMRREAGG